VNERRVRVLAFKMCPIFKNKDGKGEIMIRSIVMMGIRSMNDLPAMDRYYTRYHAPEIISRWGPWLQRFISYRVVPPPHEAEEFGYINYRVTECWWREVPGPGYGTLTATPAPAPPQVVTFYLPAQPTEEFLGAELIPDEKTILRWLIVFRYPEGVSVEEGDEWYLKVHAKEVMQQPGLTKFFSYRVEPPRPLPGWRPPPAGSTPSKPRQMPVWHRVSELWYENLDGWNKSIIESPPKYTKPPWAKYNKYPFFEPRVDFWSTFILERPTDDWLKDWRGYP
jgi:hypothetical protein